MKNGNYRYKSIFERTYKMSNSIFYGKTLLITGGTGSFGNAVLSRFLNTDIGEIRIFSRDEKKQDDMRHLYQSLMPEASNKIKFYIGDVRDIHSVRNAMHGVDYIFHAAALKQVPSCEFFPIEAVKTNVLGTENRIFYQERPALEMKRRFAAIGCSIRHILSYLRPGYDRSTLVFGRGRY